MATGPSTSISPYLLALEPNVSFTSLLTVGDKLPGSTSGVFGGIPDGLGVFDNGDGTVTVIVNHEIGGTAGVLRDHGAIGSWLDRIVIDKATLAVIGGDDAIKSVSLWNSTTQQYDLASPAFTRFCAGELAGPSAFFDATSGLGTQTRIYLAGEEAGVEGRPVATILTGADQGNAFEVAALGNQSFENLVASPFAQAKTIVATTDDTGNGQVYIFVGNKQATGTDLQKAGLDSGVLYGIKVAGIANETNANVGAFGSFTLEAVGADGNVKNQTGAQIQAASVADGITGFLRPEDAAWDPDHPNVLYFVTTNAFNNPSRLWQATFIDITRPELGGSIKAVLDGTEGQQMFDNITVSNGKVILQEDPGNQSYVAKIWEYDIASDKLSAISSFDPARFTSGLPGFITQDEESSGVVDVTALFGDAGTRAYLLDAQAHTATGDPKTVEPGQLLLMKIETPHDGGNGDDTLNGDATANTLSGFNGNDTIRGGSGDDVLRGDNGDDTLFGMADADTLYGGNGNDTLNGGSGADRLVGGRGDDVLTGGSGADVFDFGDLDGSKGGAIGNDTITDFERGIDRLVFAAGVGIKKEAHGDFNGDGTTDTLLTLSKGGAVTLLGVSSYDGGATPAASSAPMLHDNGSHDLMMLLHQMQIAIA